MKRTMDQQTSRDGQIENMLRVTAQASEALTNLANKLPVAVHDQSAAIASTTTCFYHETTSTH